MGVHPDDREANDPLRVQWERLEELSEQIVRKHRLYLSEAQRMGLGLLSVAYSLHGGRERLETLKQAEKWLSKGVEVEETKEVLARLGEEIEQVKNMEGEEIAGARGIGA